MMKNLNLAIIALLGLITTSSSSHAEVNIANPVDVVAEVQIQSNSTATYLTALFTGKTGLKVKISGVETEICRGEAESLILSAQKRLNDVAAEAIGAGKMMMLNLNAGICDDTIAETTDLDISRVH